MGIVFLFCGLGGLLLIALWGSLLDSLENYLGTNPDTGHNEMLDAFYPTLLAIAVAAFLVYSISGFLSLLGLSRGLKWPQQSEVVMAVAMASTTELDVELEEQLEVRTPDKNLVSIPAKCEQFFPTWTNEAIDNIFSAFSSLYAVIVVCGFLAFSFTEIVTFPHLNNHLEKNGFFVYLYLTGIIFFIYLFVVVSFKGRDLRFLPKLKVVFNHKSHGSLPARIGVIVFGLGTLVYFLFELIGFFEVQSGSPCHFPAVGISLGLAIIFVLLQINLIFLYPRLNLHTFNFVDRFGTMHVVATNIIIWLHSLVKEPITGHGSPRSALDVHLPRPLMFIRQGSWDHSGKGVLGGILALILAISNLGVFFGLDGFTNAEDESEFFSKLTKTVINMIGILCLVVGICQIQHLDAQEQTDQTEAEIRNLDITLLRFTSFFAYLYHSFTIITGVFNANVKNFPNKIHNINGFVAIVQITLQLIFIFDLRRKELPDSKVKDKPGRQIAIFLFFHNLAMWLVFTFEIQKVRSSWVEAEFYGIMPWIIIQRVTLPLTIFFRFHSAVVCMEMPRNFGFLRMASDEAKYGARPKQYADKVDAIEIAAKEEVNADDDGLDIQSTSPDSSVSSRYQIREEPDPTPKGGKLKMKFSDNSLANIWSGFSSLYATLLVALYLAFSFTELVTFPHLTDYLEINGFFVFLFFVSDLFLIYVLVVTLSGKSKLVQSDGAKVAENHKSHGSLTIRFGAIIFGLGALGYYTLEMISFFEVRSDSPCYHPTLGVNTGSALLFIVLQTYLIFVYPRINLCAINVLDRFGTMHVVATNIIIWIRTLIKESLHEIMESEERAHSLHTTHPLQAGHDHGVCNIIGERVRIAHQVYERCRRYHQNILGTTLIDSSPFLYPFVIEYALIGASVLFVMWRHVGRRSTPSTHNEMDSLTHTGINPPRPMQFLKKGDWSHSLKGVLAGGVILILAILNLALFFGLDGHDANEDEAEYFTKITNTIINFLGIVALVIGVIQIQNLDDNRQFETDSSERESSSLDLSLLRFTAFFSYLYICFTIITGAFNGHHHNFPNGLHILNGITEAIQISMQIVFIFDLKQKIMTLSTFDTKPGRQVTIFLFFLNIAQWVVISFEIQKVRASLVEAEFYGFMPWVIIQRVTLPLMVFFRFHSAVVNMEMWKDIYSNANIRSINTHSNVLSDLSLPRRTFEGPGVRGGDISMEGGGLM
eukprot:maker-scaffold280_size224562-snap-gene-0.12 protein:Tk08824 transcript:maker-scaffold280_size224562-snap-gene-0.12-mRNA-1 annotation:"conserved hypothetical protein"